MNTVVGVRTNLEHFFIESNAQMLCDTEQNSMTHVPLKHFLTHQQYQHILYTPQHCTSPLSSAADESNSQFWQFTFRQPTMLLLATPTVAMVHVAGTWSAWKLCLNQRSSGGLCQNCEATFFLYILLYSGTGKHTRAFSLTHNWTKRAVGIHRACLS